MTTKQAVTHHCHGCGKTETTQKNDNFNWARFQQFVQKHIACMACASISTVKQ